VKRRSFFKIVLSGAGAAVLPLRSGNSTNAAVCRWAHDHCAPHPKDQFYVTECGKDFLTVNGTREKNEFWFCPYCGQRIVDMKMNMGELCGQQILDNLPKSNDLMPFDF
jgi:DNA-directed RNA polymerase subunit RPC12/RpoP